MHTSAVDAGAGTPGLQYTRCPSRVHPYMLRVAPVYTVSIPRPPLHAARGSSIHGVHPASTPTCCAWLQYTQCPSGVHPHVLRGRGRDCGLLARGWRLVLWTCAASGHLLHPSPGSGCSRMHRVSRISTTEPSEESTMSAVPLRRHAASSKPRVHRSRLHRLLPSVPRVPPRSLVTLCPGVFPSLVTGPELPATIHLAGREGSQDSLKTLLGEKQRKGNTMEFQVSRWVLSLMPLLRMF